MGLFKRDPQKRAERQRRRAERRRARAAAAEAKANVFAKDQEEATVIGQDKAGRTVRQRVLLDKRGSQTRNARLTELERQVAELEADNESKDEEIAALTERLEKVETYLNRRSNQNTVVSAAAMKAARALVRILNVTDKVHSPGALIAAEALQLSDVLGVVTDGEDDGIDRDMATWLEAGGTLLTAYAYYDPKRGFGSILEADRPSVTVEGDSGKS